MPVCPWKDAASGLIVGGERFVEKIRGMLGGRSADPSLSELESLRPRPSLEHIVMTVARSFGTDSSCWSVGTRTDDASRAVAAFLARRRYGYRAAEVAKALGYTSHGGVAMAIKRIESASPALRRQVRQLENNLTND
jgi:chromosomal replication initiation ATPase DnaA